MNPDYIPRAVEPNYAANVACNKYEELVKDLAVAEARVASLNKQVYEAKNKMYKALGLI